MLLRRSSLITYQLLHASDHYANFTHTVFKTIELWGSIINIHKNDTTSVIVLSSHAYDEPDSDA